MISNIDYFVQEFSSRIYSAHLGAVAKYCEKTQFVILVIPFGEEVKSKIYELLLDYETEVLRQNREK